MTAPDADMEKRIAWLREMREILITAPDGHIATSLNPKLQALSDVPTAHELLEILDLAAFGGLASEFGMVLLRQIFEIALIVENTTPEQVAASATW